MEVSRVPLRKLAVDVWDIFTENVWLFIVISLLKLLPSYGYHSTDFEVHRNWLSVTWQTPLDRWYQEATSRWTLDYPPLFAYFELLLAAVARVFVPEALQLSATPIVTPRVVVFQRISVAVADVVLYLGVCCLLATHHRKRDRTVCKQQHWRTIILVLCHAGLFLVDYVHFQYNGMLIGLLFISIALVDSENYEFGCIAFAMLLCMKHLFVFVAPAYFIIIVRDLLFRKQFKRAVLCIVGSMSVVVAVFMPFLFTNTSFTTILSDMRVRMFPFERGLMHEYWAPNVWAVYATADKVLAVALRRVFGVVPQLSAPQQGIMSVLPTITPLVCIVLIAIVDVVVILRALFVSGKQRLPFPLLVSTTYCVAFMFGWHVHEKACLYFMLPLIACDETLQNTIGDVVLLTDISILPLIFTPREQPLAFTSVLFYQCLMYATGHKVSRSVVALAGATLLFYVCHAALVPQLPFAHLLVVSLSSFVGVAYCMIRMQKNITRFKS